MLPDQSLLDLNPLGANFYLTKSSYERKARLAAQISPCRARVVLYNSILDWHYGRVVTFRLFVPLRAPRPSNYPWRLPYFFGFLSVHAFWFRAVHPPAWDWCFNATPLFLRIIKLSYLLVSRCAPTRMGSAFDGTSTKCFTVEFQSSTKPLILVAKTR